MTLPRVDRHLLRRRAPNGQLEDARGIGHRLIWRELGPLVERRCRSVESFLEAAAAECHVQPFATGLLGGEDVGAIDRQPLRIFPDDQSLVRLAGMLCIEANDEWLVGRHYPSAESISLVLAGRDDHPPTENKEVPELQAA